MAIIRSELSGFNSTQLGSTLNTNERFLSEITGIKNQANGSMNSLIPASVIGINANKVVQMTGAIRTCVTNIERHLSQVHVETDPSVAFADEEMQSACRTYISGVMDVCRAYTTQLLRLATELDQIKEYYKQEQTKQASTLSQAGEQLSSSVDRYEYAGSTSN